MVARLRDFRVQLGLVVAGGLLLRFVAVLVWSSGFTPEGDEAFYWRQAQYLADGYGFVFRNNYGELVTTAVHPPLYSAYLGVVALLGLPDDVHTHLRLASAALGGVTIALVGLAGRRIAGSRAGVIAAVAAALYANLWLNEVKLTAEAVFAPMVALVVLASYRFVERRSLLDGALLGAGIALAALARAEALLLFPLLALPLVARIRGEDLATRVRQLAVIGGVGALVLAPWVVRNLVSFTNPTVLSSGAGFVLEISNCDQTYGLAPPMDGAGNPRPGATADDYLGYWTPDCDRSDRSAHGDAALTWPEGDETVVEQWKRQIGLDYMRAHRGEVPVVVLARIGRIWDVWRPGQSYDFNVFFERRGGWPTLAGMAQYYVMLPLALAALVLLWKRKVTIIPFVALALSATFTAAVSFGITRYRVGADVGLCVLTGVALDAGWRWLRGRRRTAESAIAVTAVTP
ncbi:MAG: glycosyltransferase family 39 protein [Acidimicrobiales bacterium]